MLILDISRYQSKRDEAKFMDFHKAKAAGAEFIIIRCSNGIEIDEAFEVHWYRALDAGFPVPHVYHAMRPAWTARQNVDTIYDALGGRMPGYLWLDCERNDGMSMATVESRIIQTIDQLDIEFNVGIYTRASWWNANIPEGNYPYWSLPLWVARYWDGTAPWVDSDPSYLRLDNFWSDWVLWQYSSKGPGEAYGALSKSIDLNVPSDPNFFIEEPTNGGSIQVNRLEEFEKAIEVAQDAGVSPDVRIIYKIGAAYIPAEPEPEEPEEPGDGDNGGNGFNEPAEWRKVTAAFNAQTPDTSQANNGYDDAGKPILVPYGQPGDRIALAVGDSVFVSPDNIIAAGGKRCRKLYASNEVNYWDQGLDLYCWRDDLGAVVV